MLTRSDIFDKIADWRLGAALDWISAQALLVGPHTDGGGIYHPEFVINFRNQVGHGIDFSDLHFGSRLKFSRLPSWGWVNEQNMRLRFAKLTLDQDSVLLTADLYGPDEALQMTTFEGTFVLFDQALVLIRAMSTN